MSEYSDIIREAMRLGVLEAQKILQPKKDEMSQRQAFDEFGKSFVIESERNGSVSVIRKGSSRNSKKTYSRAELSKVMAERNMLRSIIRIDSNVRS